MSLLAELVIDRLAQSAWLLRIVFALLVATFAVPFLLHQLRVRKRYEHLPTLPTTWLLGSLLGHMEHFWMSGTHLHVTVCKLCCFELLFDLFG